MKNEERAFTTLELLISIGLISIIVIFAMSFLTVDVKSTKLLRNDSELEFQSQYILNFLSCKVMESSEVVLITSVRSNKLDNTGEVAVDKAAFRYGSDERYCYIFEMKKGKIFYGNGNINSNANAELGTYVYELRMAPYPEGKRFKDAKAVRVTLVLLKDGQNYEAHQVYYMRGS